MRFDIPGLTQGPTDKDLEHLARHNQVRPEPSLQDEEAQATALGLSVGAFRALRASLERLRKGE